MPNRMGNVSRFLLWATSILLLLCVVGVGYILLSIDSGVKNYAAQAQAVHPHPDDDGLALIEYLGSDEHSFAGCNHAVWALGRLRDARALPLLEDFYTGEECAHGEALCQSELEKAIARCSLSSRDLF